jgi:hypothetical protein
MQWLLEESETIAHGWPLLHFSLIAFDSIVDIVNDYEPKIEFIKNI